MTTASRHCVFETRLGFFAIAWNGCGLTRLCLPDRDAASTRRRLGRHGVSAGAHAPSREVPGWVADLIAAITAYAAGQATEFSTVPVDLAGVDAFRLAIYAATRQLRFGETTTYGELAKRAGHAGLARETGAALGSNPVPLVIPCHRIPAAGGKIGGFSAPGGSVAKARMLALEGVATSPPPAKQQSFAF